MDLTLICPFLWVHLQLVLKCTHNPGGGEQHKTADKYANVHFLDFETEKALEFGFMSAMFTRHFGFVVPE